MTNEIKSLIPGEARRSAVAPAAQSAREAPGGARAGLAAESRRDEKVTLTDTGRKLANLSAEATKGPGVDQAKVRQLRDAIESGQYSPDPLAIADGLIRFEHDR